MQNNDKKYFIPVDGTPIEVSEEVYRAYYQPIWNTRYHAQKNGECRCTKAQLWKCDGVCPGCPFYAAGKKVSIDTPIGGEEDEFTLGDICASSRGRRLRLRCITASSTFTGCTIRRFPVWPPS